MTVAVAGHPLVVVNVPCFDFKAGTGSDAVIMLMAVVEGYIADQPVSMTSLVGFLTGYSRQSMAVLMGRGGFTIVAVAMYSFRHKIISLK